MAVKLKLVDVTKLKKSSYLVLEESKAVVREARAMLDKQEEFMKNGGRMDRKKLRSFINSGYWTAWQKQKSREELLNFYHEFKDNMANEASAKRKELRNARNMFSQRKGKGKRARIARKRTGLV